MAKIAYCTAIEAYGIDTFNPPVIPDLILGRYSAISYFVGPSLDLPPPREHASIPHRVTIECGIWKNRMPVLVAMVRLFAHSGTLEYGMPVYRVLLGIPSAQLRNRLSANAA